MKRVVVIPALCSVVALAILLGGTTQQPVLASALAAGEQATLVVDRSNRAASDKNPGTPERPLRTVARAATLASGNNLRGIATRIMIRPGVYRESVSLGPWRGQTSAPISFEGPVVGTAVLSGSDVWSAWTPVPGTDLYQHPWPYRWGLTPLPRGWERAQMPEIARRREMVFADGRLLRQTLNSAELAEISGGAFTIDGANGLITLRLPRGLPIGKVRTEVATRQQLLRIADRKHVHISNLTFQHAASPLQQPAARIERSSDIQLSNAKFLWNNWTGLALNDDRDITIERSTFDHNGSMGLSALRVNTLTLDHSSNSDNAWRGHWGGWHGWENGMKLIGVHHAVLRNHTATGNQSYGLWLDTDNRDVAIQDARICDNRLAGVFLEASQGPIRVDDTTICRNGDRGILASNASQVTITNSRILENAQAQITLSGVQSGLPVTDWESRQSLNVQSTNWTVRKNSIKAAGGQLLVDNTWSAGTWARARPGYAWTENTWTSPTDKPFRLLGSYRLGNLSEWQRHTGLDKRSRHRRPLPVPRARML